jgi:hypothetical protein
MTGQHGRCQRSPGRPVVWLGDVVQFVDVVGPRGQSAGHELELHAQYECNGRPSILPHLSRAVGVVSRTPDQFRVVGDTLLGFEIPILGVFESCGMAVEEDKLRAVAVQVGMYVIPLGDRRQLAVVEQPDRHIWLRNADHSRRKIVGSGAIYVVIQAIVKKIVCFGTCVATAEIRGTNPN